MLGYERGHTAASPNCERAVWLVLQLHGRVPAFVGGALALIGSGTSINSNRNGKKPRAMVYTRPPSTWEVEAGGSDVLGILNQAPVLRVAQTT